MGFQPIVFEFRALYYVNNVVFSFLLLSCLLLICIPVFLFFQRFGLASDTTLNFKGTSFQLVRSCLSLFLSTVAFYQSFLGLFEIKENTENISFSRKKIRTAAVIFLVVATLNLFDIYSNRNVHAFAVSFHFGEFIIGINLGVYIPAIIGLFFLSFASSPSMVPNAD
jgi:hypothetical protein